MAPYATDRGPSKLHGFFTGRVIVDERLIELVSRLSKYGDSQYGGEAVTQLEHGLQAAALARGAGATNEQIVAALLHDVGHLLHDLPNDSPDQGIDDRHELLALDYLSTMFPPAVTEPIRLHVEAKRYLSAKEPAYMAALSEPSRISLQLQGGPMSHEEALGFEAHPFFSQAVELRRWDDGAKVAGLTTPSLETYLPELEAVLTSVAS